MIGFIRGVILQKNVPRVLIETTGLGYEVETSMTTFFQLPEIGASVYLFTHFNVREDAQTLYGFIDEDERILFRSLIKVNGVGPKLALAILSGIHPAAFMQCVRDNDTASLIRLPGVGKKTAERLVIELRDKLNNLKTDENATNAPLTTTGLSGGNHATQEAVSALIALGYKPQEASRAISRIDDAANFSSEELIRRALKGMAEHG